MWDLCLIPGRVGSLYSVVMLCSDSAVCLSARNSHLSFTCCSLIPVSPFTHVGAHSAHSCRLMWKWGFWDMCWLVWTIFSSGPFLDANLAMVTDKLLELCSCLIFYVYDYSVYISEFSVIILFNHFTVLFKPVCISAYRMKHLFCFLW